MTAKKRRNSKIARIEHLTQGRPASMPVTRYQYWQILWHTERDPLHTAVTAVQTSYFFCPNNVSIL
jgi:hypothetical protein